PGLGRERRVELHQTRYVAVVPDDRAQLPDQVTVTAEPLGVRLVPGPEYGLEQLLLRPEVVQQAGLAQPDCGREFPCRRLPVAVPGDHVERRPQDLLPLGDPFGVRTPGSHAEDGTEHPIENLALFGFRAYSRRMNPSPVDFADLLGQLSLEEKVRIL